MKSRDFFLSGLVIIVLVSLVTSILAVYIFQRGVLKGPSQEGTVDIFGGVPTVVDVIIIDDTVVAGITDAVTFSGVTLGSTHETDTNSLTLGSPYPFVVRNNGNVNAHIEIDQRRSATQTGLGLFDETNSKLKYWVEDVKPIGGVSGYSTLDNCVAVSPSTSCILGGSSPCSTKPSTSGTTCVIPLAASGRSAVADVFYQDAYDEIFLHILIFVATTESGGVKSTIVTLTGSAA